MIFRSIIILIVIIISGINISAEEVKNYTFESKHIDFIEIEDKTTIQVEIPNDVEMINYGTIMILREDVTLEAIINGKSLMKVEPSDDKGVKTTGKGWSILPITEEYVGQTMTIVMENVYEKMDGTAKVYIGDSRRILWSILRESIVDIFVCTILVFIAIILLVVSRMDIGGRGKEKGIIYLACFAISLVLWRLGQISILRLFITADHMWSNIGYIGLSFAPITFIMHFATVFNQTEYKSIDWFCKLNLVAILFQQIAQITGVAEFRESAWITYLLTACVIGFVGYTYKKEGMRHRTTKNSTIMNFIGVFIILVGLGTILYKITGNDVGISALGALIYICVLAIERVRSIRIRSMKTGQIDVYKKLAFIDEMTGLYNRTAFEYDFDKYNEIIRSNTEDISRLAVLVIDINNLKFCNDKYGHDKGDIYIKTVSSAILESFCDDCKCYRMGGDEFCIIYENATLEDIEDRAKYMRMKVDNVNKRNIVFKYNYALGYEWYDSNQDKTLQDTFKRADEKMYQTKRIMKSLGG